jgi:tRNA uridine 5-carboxymethylaminomethyl modification enzyme
LGLLTRDEMRGAETQLAAEDSALASANSAVLTADQANGVLLDAGSSPVTANQRVADLARRPGVRLAELLRAAGIPIDGATDWADIELKYAGYLERERASAARVADMDGLQLPHGIPYYALHALSLEARQKLSSARPETLGQAGRIPGVSPSDLQNLLAAVLKGRCSTESGDR